MFPQSTLQIYSTFPINGVFSLSTFIAPSKSEAYLEPSQTSVMELFYENSCCLKAVDCFRRKAPSQMIDRVLDMPLLNDLLQLTEGLRRSFPTLGLGKGILDSRSLVIPLINTKNKKKTHPMFSFRWKAPGTKRQYI